MSAVAIVGMACRYPDAASPTELWENAVTARRAFRRMPDKRMSLDDYYDPDPAAPDRFYATNAAVIEGYEFDRLKYKVAGSTYRSTDLTHWLALDMAATALADAGFPMAEGLARERAGVVIGNSLTGEFSRAGQLRLRWPYVRRTLADALRGQGWDDESLTRFLADFETRYKAPFPGVDEDTLAGGLSNTIAGRICNHFDLKGGGYTVDGACSSSLLSVSHACTALTDGELDVVVAGGVDLSIDPFELIGFAKTGALARREMRVYDKGSNGFWPGEGCGMVVLMRQADAVEAGHRIYATIAGWGISSDGRGGITRPEVSGYQLALRRAYDRAGFGVDTVALFEGHGTGTAVGDATELRALMQARRAADPQAAPAAIGSVKGMIGHTKAAAGVAGLIKATMALHHRTLPPSVGSADPHELLTGPDAGLRVLRSAEPWPAGVPLRAGVTAMGFGGINTHVVLEDHAVAGESGPDPRIAALTRAPQDAELLLVDGAGPAELRDRLQRLAEFVPALSYGELADLAVALHEDLRDLPYRAAVLATSPADAEHQFRELCQAIDAGETMVLSGTGRRFLGRVSTPGRIGFLFPGQGSGRGISGGAIRRRFAEVDEVFRNAALPVSGDVVATAVAQPRIVTGSLAGLAALRVLGMDADIAVGHSLGELTALTWAGAMDDSTLLRIAAARGRTMAEHSSSGTMAGLNVSADVARDLIAGTGVVVAGHNGPDQTVVSGSVADIETVCRRAADKGLRATPLAVSHAFHSPLVAPAARVFAGTLGGEQFQRVGRSVMSTVTGELLPADTDLATLLHRQITEPVLFSRAVALAAKDIDLLVEVGPGRVLTGLAAGITEVPAVALDTDDESLTGLLRAVGAAYVLGAPVDGTRLFQDRPLRPLRPGATFAFLENPCEQAPELLIDALPGESAEPDAAESNPEPTVDGESTLDLLRRLAAERAELPVEMISPESLLLDDLHLSSITVANVTNQAAQALGVAASSTPLNFATASIRQLADALDELRAVSPAADATRAGIAGAAAWSRAFAVDLDEAGLPPRTAQEDCGTWQTYSCDNHPLSGLVREALERGHVGDGILVCLPQDCPPDKLELALRGAQAAAVAPGGTRFVLVQRGRGAAGMAKTLHLESPCVRVTVVDVPFVPDAVDLIVAEVAATDRFNEAHYGRDGVRRVPTLRALPIRAERPEPVLGPDDVLLVTGGGKGITAECAMAVAADSGARLAVLGRSDPAADEELAANLARMSDRGLTVRYARADITDPGQVARAVTELEDGLGPVTAVLHGAGRNEPTGLPGLDMAAVGRTLAPKVDGLHAVLDAVEPSHLRLLVTFGSIIGRAGLRGEAHYSTANEWLADLTTRFAERHPDCRTLCLEWSVWAGVGMGERLSVVESLSREGITAITLDQGVEIMRRLVADPDAPSVVVVSGRTEGIATVRRDEPELPLHRFLERVLLRYHGVELVAEATLSGDADRYLRDHHLDGNLLFPAVFGMEAMAQAATALTGRTTVPRLEDVEFARPIIVPPDGSTVIRIAAVVVDDDTVEVAIRSAETGFGADHFRARLRFDDQPLPDGPPSQMPDGLPAVPLAPATDLYGDVLFQGARFQRLRRYHRAAARHVDAEVDVHDSDWFTPFLPGELLLGDPGMRDALMHGNQVCVPDATLLPSGVDRIWPGGARLRDAGPLRYCATERSRDGDVYVYDIAVRTGTGEVVERWEGLRLHAVRRTDRSDWAAALLGPYVERVVGDLCGFRVAVALEPAADEEADEPAGRRRRTAVAIGRALGRTVDVGHRPDGRPEIAGPEAVSVAHTDGLTLAVTAGRTVACDLETVEKRSAVARDWLLGPHAHLGRLISAELGEDPDMAMTRVWTAVECLQKAGLPAASPLTVRPSVRPGWVVLASGPVRIATFAAEVDGRQAPTIVAVLGTEED